MRSVKPQPSRAGFTLLEVATALAIFAFASVGLISVIPMAIVTHKQAVGNTILAQITQQLTGEVQMCGPAEFASYNSQTWCFDYEGNQLTGTNPTGTVYRAETVVKTTQLPGQTASSTSLQLVQIYAVFDPTPTGTTLTKQVSSGIPNGVVVVSQPTTPTVTVGL